MMSYELLKANLGAQDPAYDFETISNSIVARRNSLVRFLQKKGLGKDWVFDDGLFSLDGSIVLDKSQFNRNPHQYFSRSRRVTLYRQKYHLRGAKYTISANPTFELRQKIDSLKEDLLEGIDTINISGQSIYDLAIADYIKNSILTVFNGYVYSEKIGKILLDSSTYQSHRRQGSDLCKYAVQLFYALLTGHPIDALNAYVHLKNNIRVFDKLCKGIVDQYQNGTFSSRHITRPEATHPQTICAAAMSVVAKRHIQPDVIVGLPSGATELAFAYAFAFQVEYNKNFPVLLFPVSFHSIKRDFDKINTTSQSNKNAVKRLVLKNKSVLDGKVVLIVDDNSSTGRTIELIADTIEQETVPRKVHVSVAEADLIRSQLDKDNPDRPSIANPILYNHSISVLPVSKKIAPKFDLKEVLEKRKVVKCIENRYLVKSSSLSRMLIGLMYVDLIKNDTKDVVSILKPNQIVDGFRRTFLSNFWQVKVIYKKSLFLSVEHGYQAMKFSKGALGKVTDDDIAFINKRLEPRGTVVSKTDLPNLFTDEALTAGTSKIAANSLRIRGYVREDWDFVKIDIMTELLIQKFSHDNLYEMLQATGSKYLIEGNDWGDTYWGVVNNRGRNVLGRLLMEIRKLDLKQLKDETRKILKNHR